MKLKKILAAVAAAAVAVSTMAVSAFAIDKGTYVVDDGGNTFLYLVADDGKTQWAVDNNVDVTTIYGVTWHATFSEAEVADDAAWIGGGLGANSNSTGWKQLEWGRSGKDYIADLENGTITWKSTEPIFKADDKYVHLWITTWGGTVTFDSVDILDKDGNVIQPGEAPAPAASEATEIWSGSTDMGTDWSGSVVIDAAQLADVAEGSTVEIEYTAGEADFYNLKVASNTDNWPALSSPTVNDWGAIEVTKDAASYSFTINADDVAKIQESGMVIQGYAVTVTKVTVSGAAAAPVVEETATAEAPEAEEAEDEDVDEEESEPVAVAETEEAAPVAEVAPAVENTSAPATGNTAVATVVAVMAVAGAAAIVSKKRK